MNSAISSLAHSYSSWSSRFWAAVVISTSHRNSSPTPDGPRLEHYAGRVRALLGPAAGSPSRFPQRSWRSLMSLSMGTPLPIKGIEVSHPAGQTCLMMANITRSGFRGAPS
jgi:hypothetical protein